MILLVICDMPDNISAAALSMAISAGGAVKAAKTTPLMTFDEGLEALQRAKQPGTRRRAARSPTSASIEEEPEAVRGRSRAVRHGEDSVADDKEEAMGTSLDDAALDAMFRTVSASSIWMARPAGLWMSSSRRSQRHALGTDERQLLPGADVFVTSPAAKERLKPLILAGNQQKVMTAPVTAILGYDTQFYDWLPRLFPHADARSWFLDKPEFAEATAFRNSSLQGAYFIIAARALGLDCGPMSGFDNEAVDREFFPGGRVKSNFYARWGTVTRRACSSACPVRRLARCARSCRP